MSSEQTYGGPSGANNSTIEYAENALIAGVSGKKVFPIVLPPTAQTNPSEVITETYVAPNLTTVIQKTIGATTYTKTIVENYTTGVTTETVWS